jgi:hypothetical protein
MENGKLFMIKLTYAQIASIHEKLHHIDPLRGKVNIVQTKTKYLHTYITIDGMEYHIAKNGNMKEMT